MDAERVEVPCPDCGDLPRPVDCPLCDGAGVIMVLILSETDE